MARRARRRRVLVIVLVVLVALIAAGGVSAYTFLTRDEPVVYEDIVQQYKYGSIGTEELQGCPYEMWVVLPDVFADLLPPGPGKGYERFGFTLRAGARDADRDDVPREADRPGRPQLRALPRRHVPRHCRFSAADRPGNAFQSDEALELHPVPAKGRARRALQCRHAPRGGRPPLSRQVFLLRPAVLALRRHPADSKAGSKKPTRTSSGSTAAPSTGPDVSTRSTRSSSVRTSTWRPTTRWARSTFPRSGNSARGSACTCTGTATTTACASATSPPRERSAGRTTRSTSTSSTGSRTGCSTCLRPPFPEARIDPPLARRGQTLYDQQCASCHDIGGARVGQVTPIEEIGTDRERLDSFTPALVTELNTNVGKGKPWRFRHFRKTDGYANLLLEGIWLTGSVPPQRQRPDSSCAALPCRAARRPSTSATTSTTGRTSASSRAGLPLGARVGGMTRACAETETKGICTARSFRARSGWRSSSI